jgi:hypothetical protein
VTEREWTESRLRSAFARRAGRAASGDDCPDTATLWHAVRCELPRSRIREIGLHATVCPACAEAWCLAREIASQAPRDVLPFDRAIARGRRSWVGGMLAAAAAVILLALLLPQRLVRDSGGPAPLRGAEEVIHALNDPAAPLARDACALRWAGPADARWDIRVATEDLSVIAQAHDLEAPSFVVPQQALSELPRGARILWQVHATLPDGRRVASRTFVQSLD